MSNFIQRLSRYNYCASISRKNVHRSFCWNSEQAPIEKACTPPREWYTNKEIYNDEQQNLLKKYPQYIGHIGQLSKDKGSYFAGNILNEPFIVIRQNHTTHSSQENKIGSFFNVCRHHASQLTVANHGFIDCNKGLKCPYHGWTYNVNGQLIKATQLNGIQDFKRKDYGLLSIPNHLLFDNLIFLDLSLKQTESEGIFENIIKSVTKYTEDHEFKNDNLIHVYSRKYLINCNWKVFVENYLDGGYHVPHLHVDLNNNFNPNTYKTVIDDYVSFQSVESSTNTNNDKKGVDFVERVGDRALFTYIYPNFMINRYGRWMDINYVYPKNVDETYVHFDYFIEGETDNMKSDIVEISDQQLMNGYFNNLREFDDSQIKFIKDSIVASNQVQLEDIMICEAVAKGLKSSGYNYFGGRYAPSLETGLYQFHQLYNKDMFL